VSRFALLAHPHSSRGASMPAPRSCPTPPEQSAWSPLAPGRNRHFPADLREGDKYIYTAVQYDHPVYGWSSTTKNVGFWLVNPSVEYLSGGPTKGEVLFPPGTTRGAPPRLPH